jgi:hypothetical protein
MAVTTLVTDEVASSSNLNGATVANLNAVDGNWATATANNVNTAVRVGVQNLPTGQRSQAGADLQTATVQLRKNTTNSGNPTATIGVGVTGGDAQVTSGSLSVTAAPSSSQTETLTFDASAISGLNEDGSNLEIIVTTSSAGGGPSARNSVDIGYVAWVADHEDIPAGTASNLLGWTGSAWAPVKGWNGVEWADVNGFTGSGW